MLHLPHRPHRPRHRVAALTLALSVLPTVLLPVSAVAATTFPSPKAAIEHAERQAAEATQPNQPNKAQIEHHEAQLPVPASQDRQPESGSTGDAALWQLALSAGLGAVLTGAVVVTSRRVGQHRHVATS
jgi:hypothetical protein